MSNLDFARRTMHHGIYGTEGSEAILSTCALVKAASLEEQ